MGLGLRHWDAQLELGRKVSAQIRGKPLAELESVLKLCLDQDDYWVSGCATGISRHRDGTSIGAGPAAASS